jgi:hypothetical protein
MSQREQPEQVSSSSVTTGKPPLPAPDALDHLAHTSSAPTAAAPVAGPKAPPPQPPAKSAGREAFERKDAEYTARLTAKRQTWLPSWHKRAHHTACARAWESNAIRKQLCSNADSYTAAFVERWMNIALITNQAYPSETIAAQQSGSASLSISSLLDMLLARLAAFLAKRTRLQRWHLRTKGRSRPYKGEQTLRQMMRWRRDLGSAPDEIAHNLMQSELCGLLSVRITGRKLHNVIVVFESQESPPSPWSDDVLRFARSHWR